MFHLIYKLQFISKISRAYLTFFNDAEEHEFLPNCNKWSTVKLHAVRNQKKIGLLILLNCQVEGLTVFTTMCPEEQLTSDI